MLAVVLLTLLLSACIADTSQGLTPTAQPSVSPGATPSGDAGSVLTPQPGVKADIANARQLEADGDYENAVNVYIAVAAAQPDNRTEATLSAARLLLDLDKPDDVRILLETYLAQPNITGDGLAAHYMLARAYSALQRYDDSLKQYDAYIQTGRAALPYAYLDRARVLMSLNRPADAAQSAQDGLALGVPSTQQNLFELAIAQGFEGAGNLDDAITWYQKLLDQGYNESLALSRIAAIKQIRGDPTFQDDLTNLMSNYPASSQAMGALQDATSAGTAVLPSIAGLIYYRHNDYSTAEPFFQTQIDDAPDDPASALAYYYRGAIRESKGQPDDAADDYAKVVALDPQSPLADDALWWRARILENEQKYDDAGTLYQQIVSDYPSSSFVDDASFRRGMLKFRAGDYAGAASIWGEDQKTAPDDSSLQRLQLWQAKALQLGGSTAAAKPILENLATKQEDDYIGIRALGLEDGQQSQPHAAIEPKVDLTPSFDWAAADTWISQKVGRPATDKVWQSDNRWDRAQELWRVGRSSYAELEVYDSDLEQHQRRHRTLYTGARAAQRRPRQHVGTRRTILAARAKYDAGSGPAESDSLALVPRCFRTDGAAVRGAGQGVAAAVARVHAAGELLRPACRIAGRSAGPDAAPAGHRHLAGRLDEAAAGRQRPVVARRPQPGAGRAVHGQPAIAVQQRAVRGPRGLQRRPDRCLRLARRSRTRRRHLPRNRRVLRNTPIHTDRVGELRHLPLPLRRRSPTGPAEVEIQACIADDFVCLPGSVSSPIFYAPFGYPPALREGRMKTVLRTRQGTRHRNQPNGSNFTLSLSQAGAGDENKRVRLG